MHTVRKSLGVCLAAAWLLATAGVAAPALAQDTAADLVRIKQQLAEMEKMGLLHTGQRLYDAACATCHGFRGDGLGPEATQFAQRATDFTKGVFKLRTTSAKLPAPGDIERSIREGLPGTEMVAFRGILSEIGISAVASYVKIFVRTPPDPTQLSEVEQKRVKIPDQRPAATPDSIAKGKQIYIDRCLECHGEKGEGSNKEKDDWGLPVIMMDLRTGIYKSGTTDIDLYRTIQTGMTGTSMGGYAGEFSDDEVWATIDYMRSLVPRKSLFEKLLTSLLEEQPSRFGHQSR